MGSPFVSLPRCLAHRSQAKQGRPGSGGTWSGTNWLFVEPIARRLERYEKERDKYKSIVDFYPELVKAFAELAEKDAP